MQRMKADRDIGQPRLPFVEYMLESHIRSCLANLPEVEAAFVVSDTRFVFLVVPDQRSISDESLKCVEQGLEDAIGLPLPVCVWASRGRRIDKVFRGMKRVL